MRAQRKLCPCDQKDRKEGRRAPQWEARNLLHTGESAFLGFHLYTWHRTGSRCALLGTFWNVSRKDIFCVIINRLYLLSRYKATKWDLEHSPRITDLFFMNETWDNRCHAEDVSGLILLLAGVIIHMSNGDVRAVCKPGQGEASSAGSHRPVLCTGHLLWGLHLTYFPHTRGDEQTHEWFKEHRAKTLYEPE